MPLPVLLTKQASCFNISLCSNALSFLSPPAEPSPLHPFTRVASHITRVARLAFNVEQLTGFTAQTRSQCRDIIWTHQFNLFYNSRTEGRSLPLCYARIAPPIQQLPMYLLHDDPATATHRARLRFRRAHINHHRSRMNYAGATPTCTQCTMQQDKTTEHMLCVCTRIEYDDARALLLSILSPPQNLSVNTVLCPSCLPDLFHSVNTITGRYIVALQKIRLF